MEQAYRVAYDKYVFEFKHMGESRIVLANRYIMLTGKLCQRVQRFLQLYVASDENGTPKRTQITHKTVQVVFLNFVLAG